MSKTSREIRKKKSMDEQKDRISRLGSIVSVEHDNNHKSDLILAVKFDTGVELHFSHCQDCCEAVWLEDGLDELTELVGGGLITLHKSRVDLSNTSQSSDNLHVATFYKLKTTGGYATLRFEGVSNGYYGVEVEVHLVSESGDKSIQLNL